MKKTLKIISITVGVILLLLFVMPIMLRGKIDNIIKKEANEMLNAKLDFENLDISLFRHFPYASIDLKDLTIVGVNKFDKDTLAYVNRVSIVVDIISLFKDSGFEVTKFIINKPEINALVLQSGEMNWDIMKSTETPEQEPEVETSEDISTFKMSLKDVRIDNGSVYFSDKTLNMLFGMKNINLKLTGDMAGDVTDLNIGLTADNMQYVIDNVKLLDNGELDIKAIVNADLANMKFTLSKNSIRLNAIKLALDGWVAMVDDAIDMDVKLSAKELQFKELLSMTPAFYTKDFKQLSASGELSFLAWAKGRMQGDALPAFGAKLKVLDAMFKYADLPMAVDKINIEASVKNDDGNINSTIVDVSLLSLAMGGNALKASLYAKDLMTDMSFRTAINGVIDLGRIKEVYPLDESMTLNGVVTANVKMAATMSDIEAEKFNKIDAQGDFSINNMSFVVKDLPKVEIKNMKASINPRSMKLDKLQLLIGKSDVNVKGELSNYINYALKNDKLVGVLMVDSKLLDLNEIMSYVPEEEVNTEAKTNSSEEDALTVFEVPENIDFTLSSSIDKILFQKMIIEKLWGMIVIDKGTVNMKKLSMNALGGELLANCAYSTAENKQNPFVDMSLNFKNVSFVRSFEELDIIKQLVPIFEKTGGTYSMGLNMSMNLDAHMMPELNTINGKGSLSSNNIDIQNLGVLDDMAAILKDDKLKKAKLKDLNIKFELIDGKLKTAPFDVKIAGANINMSGTTGLDKSIDYAIKVTLPKGTAGGYVSKVNGSIKGTFDSPKVSLDLKNMVEDAVKNAIVNEVLGGKDISEEIDKHAEKLMQEAKTAGEKLVDLARKAGEKLVNEAKNPLTKMAAKKAAETLVKEAQYNANKLVSQAEKEIENLRAKSQK